MTQRDSRGRFVKNPQFEHEYAGDRKLRALLQSRVEAASRHAEGISPIDTGAYRSSHVVGEPTIENGRLVIPFGNTDTDANIVEFGAGSTPAYHVLERAAQSAEFEFQGE